MMNIQSMVKKTQRFFGKNAGDIAIGALVGALVWMIVVPSVVNADINTEPKYPNEGTVSLLVEAMRNQTRSFGTLPVADAAEPRQTIRVSLTAYNSEVGQTDSTPFITASGSHVRDGIVAANFLPIGTKVRIPELFGNKVFVVEDRMNKRYWHKMDIWMEHKSDAKQFGIKYATVEIY